jgi:hypothetical protein
VKGCLTSCRTRRPPASAGRKRSAGNTARTAAANSSWSLRTTRSVPGSTRPSVSTTNSATTSPLTPARRSISG